MDEPRVHSEMFQTYRSFHCSLKKEIIYRIAGSHIEQVLARWRVYLTDSIFSMNRYGVGHLLQCRNLWIILSIFEWAAILVIKNRPSGIADAESCLLLVLRSFSLRSETKPNSSEIFLRFTSKKKIFFRFVCT
jgi:hypothetical protein